MRKVHTPDWLAYMVKHIAFEEGIPLPEVVFKIMPAERRTVGYTKPHWDSQSASTVRYKREYIKHYAWDTYSATAYNPRPRLPDGRIVFRVRNPNHPLLAMLALHELGHLIADAREGGKRQKHSPTFYWHLFQLVDKYGPQYGVAVDEMARWEGRYKSRNAPKGYEMFLASKPLTAAA